MTQTATDYSDIFCQAVQNIVDGTVSNLNFDISRECSIISIIDKAYGKYKVSDGSISFEAVATEGSSYKTGDRVMVTIPQGDSNKQIIILNKIIDEWSGPAGFVRPLDTITSCTGNIAFNEHDERKLLANSKVSTINILTLKNQKFFGFQRVGVAAKFKSLLENLNIIKGDYGLIFTLIQYSKDKNVPKKVDQHKFSCSEMLGNPYAFNSYFEQEYAFNVDGDIKQINELIVDFYQDGQFVDGNDNILDFSFFGKNYYNLFVKDLEIYLGYPQGKEISEIVEIVSDNLEYTGSGNETRDIYLQWIHKLDEYHYENITHQKYYSGEDIYEIRWYQYTPKCSSTKTDEYGGKNWELLNKIKPENAWDDYPFTFTVNVRPTYMEEKIKAVCLIKTYPLVNDPTYEQIVKFTSNVLTFENTREDSGEDVPPEETLKKNLSLHFHDNSYGNYFLYDQNGIIIDGANQGQSLPREIEVFYDGEPLNKNQNWFNSIDAITWELPAPNQSTSMIYYDKTQTTGFVEPNKNLVGSFLNGNWKKYYKTNDSNDFIEDNNFESIGTDLFRIPIEFNKNQETFIVSNINNSINGKFNLKAKVLSTLNIKDKNGKDISFSNNLPVSIKLSIWVRDNGSKWTLINNIYKTIKISKEYKESQLSEIEGLFSIVQKHDEVRIGFGLTSEQGDDFNKLIEDNKENNISWDLYINNETFFSVQSEFYTNTNYPSKDENGKTVLNTIFTYSILNSWSRDRNNNTIRCKVTVDGKDYLLQEELRFGPKGSNGTSNTFILEMLDGKNALTTTGGEKPEGSNYFDTLRVEAILIKGNGKRYYFTEDQIKEIKWELINNNSKYIFMDTKDEDSEYAIKSLHLVTNTVPSDNYAILKASFKYEQPDANYQPVLEAYLQIPIKHYTCRGMSGPREIIYNHQGKPQQGNNVYIAYIDNKEIYKEWSIQQSEKNPNPVALKETGDPSGGRSLAATPLYSKKDAGGPIYDKVCVYCDYTDDSNETIRLWSQPILIMQSNYDFAMLNEWDGTLTIDEKNGTILATMLGAGRKNDQNQFSGVLLGDIQDGTDLNNTESMTGVYGLQDGIMTYALKENGTGYFGAQGRGRIEFDGTSGIIRSAGWKQNNGSWILNPPKGEEGHDENILVRSTGTLLDLDDGMLLMNGGNDSYFRFNNDGTGKLEMALSGANIKLTDKSNSNLSAYIDISAQQIISEVRRAATYFGTSSSTGALKTITLTKNVGNDLNKDYNISEIQNEELLKTGVMIAITFSEEEKVTIKKTTSDNGAVTETRTGRALSLQFNTDPKYQRTIWINGEATSENNPFGWTENSTIYFAYVGDKNFGHWEVTDSGTYSRITQTADEIRSEVSTIDGKLSTQITQTASDIRTEVSNLEENLSTKITQTAGKIETEVSNLEQDLLSKITQTDSKITAEVTRAEGAEKALSGRIDVQAGLINAKVSSSGGANGFGWSLTDSGFILTSTINNTSTNVFVCNKDGVYINGNGTFTGTIYANDGEFAGNLTAVNTKFNSLTTSPITIAGGIRESIFKNGWFQLAVGTDANHDPESPIYNYGGYLYVGAPDFNYYDDVTIWPELIAESVGQEGYGNIGTVERPWNQMTVYSNMSKRELKQDIMPYNIDQAYEELKTLPLYTYRYLRGNSSKTLFLGTIIDYMPIEFMRTTNKCDGSAFEPNNIMFWNIAASQVIQSKLENLIERVNYLEQECQKYGIN